ncbi:MAG TPA: YncE family protein [Candidatus Acidoferrales bacterium]|nr:YncE family protein [Candidatus Acidoferrales bacterium]
MPIAPAAPAIRIPVFSGFDYMTVDEARHRVFAAHSRSDRLLVVDTSAGTVAGQVDVGPMHGLAVDPPTGLVFTADGTDQNISKVDPVAMKVLATVDVPGNLDGMAYDPARERLYADQSGGGNVYVVDAKTMKLIGTIPMPADDLESVSVDPATGTVYQNLANGGGFAIVDGTTMKVVKVVKTPELKDNHPLVFAPAAGQVIVGGENGVLSAYAPDGTLVGSTPVQVHIDQCSTGATGSLVACAGKGVVGVVAVAKGRPPKVVAKVDTGHTGIHTVAIDESTKEVWVVWSDTQGDWVQRLQYSP